MKRADADKFVMPISAPEIGNLLVSTYGFKAINLGSLDGFIAEFK